MTPQKIYETYIALKVHFNKPSYDYVKYEGRIKFNSVDERRDKVHFYKFSKKLSSEKVLPFFVFQFFENRYKWIGDMGDNYDDFLKWYGKRCVFYNTFKTDLKTIINQSDKSIKDVFIANLGSYPKIFLLLIQKRIEPETYIILDHYIKFSKIYDRRYTDIVYKHWSENLRNLRSFVSVNDQNFEKIIKNVVNI